MGFRIGAAELLTGAEKVYRHTDDETDGNPHRIVHAL